MDSTVLEEYAASTASSSDVPGIKSCHRDGQMTDRKSFLVGHFDWNDPNAFAYIIYQYAHSFSVPLLVLLSTTTMR
jgi:hypothetical protein